MSSCFMQLCLRPQRCGQRSPCCSVLISTLMRFACQVGSRESSVLEKVSNPKLQTWFGLKRRLKHTSVHPRFIVIPLKTEELSTIISCLIKEKISVLQTVRSARHNHGVLEPRRYETSWPWFYLKWQSKSRLDGAKFRVCLRQDGVWSWDITL